MIVEWLRKAFSKMCSGNVHRLQRQRRSDKSYVGAEVARFYYFALNCRVSFTIPLFTRGDEAIFPKGGDAGGAERVINKVL